VGRLLLLLLAAGLLPGCPRPLDLAATRFETMEIFSWSGPSYCVGRPFQLGLDLGTAEGDVFRTVKRGEDTTDRIPLTEFSFSAVGADVDEEGFVVDHDALATLLQPLEIQASFRRDPRLEATLTLFPRYDCERDLPLRAVAGRPGPTGSPGEDGATGSDGQGTAGGERGGDGGPGATGGAGAAGEDGPEVEIAAGLISTRWHRLVVLLRITRVDSPDRPPAYHLVEAGVTEGFVISVEGGTGGAGGAGGGGGGGGNGGNAAAGAQPGDGGDGAAGGNGGDGGDGGQGGTVRVLYDDQHPELVQWLRFAAPGGRGGRGGHGGPGGVGGRGGTIPGEKDAVDGLAGSPGEPGGRGRAGAQGAPGPSIEIKGRPRERLFADEIARGLQFR